MVIYHFSFLLPLRHSRAVSAIATAVFIVAAAAAIADDDDDDFAITR